MKNTTKAKIKNIQKLTDFDDEYVYDVCMDEEVNKWFFGNNILLHNSVYFETWAENNEEAIIVADHVAGAVSDTFQKFMKDTFLCAEGFDNIIKAGREIVSDRGIFVDKKRYILHIINDDGFPVDKIKVMGLDTKKTTLPKAVADTLNGFVERFLKNEEWDVIATDIVDYKKVLENANTFDIGLPKGVKKVEIYTAEYELDNSTRLPGHVAASIFYNICRKEFGDNESPMITSGMKIKVFYLQQKTGRFKSIAVPVDMGGLPEWFNNDNFPILMEAHIERLVDKPLNNIIKAIGKQTPSEQSLMTDSLLGF